MLISKKQLRSNLTLSLSVVFLLLLFSIISKHIVPAHYYCSVGFFFLIYIIQSFFLMKIGTSPTRFVAAYNFTTIFKMIASALFLIFYYLLFSDLETIYQKIQFTLFFTTLYFVYLIINIRNNFSK